ncbi:hypothetical protein Dxin01_00750 [Deinococcus xinjiangensis]|uniref:Uncharacterized protein n=1 Tax=Deinococcus xinjiangensis TaxID=457454 RepID=A0ABP9V6W2_9DEIO
MIPFRIADHWKAQLPAHTIHVLELYVNSGPAALSTFHLKLLSGDAFGAACYADTENRAAMGVILAMVAADFPTSCYGTKEAVESWSGLLHGQQFSVPHSWAVAVEELRRDGPHFEPQQEPATADKRIN